MDVANRGHGMMRSLLMCGKVRVQALDGSSVPRWRSPPIQPRMQVGQGWEVMDLLPIVSLGQEGTAGQADQGLRSVAREDELLEGRNLVLALSVHRCMHGAVAGSSPAAP